MVCLQGTADAPTRWLFNFYLLPAQSEPEIRSSLATLWPAQVGRMTSHRRIASPVGFNLAGGSWATGSSAHWQDSFQVSRRDSLNVNGGLRPVIIFERQIVGIIFSNHSSKETYWWDIETGAWIKREVSLINGTTAANSYEAVRIENR